MPWLVVDHPAAQLGIEDPSVVKRYTERPKTAYEHTWEIRDEDVARLSPLKHRNLNLLGRYSFTTSNPLGLDEDECD